MLRLLYGELIQVNKRHICSKPNLIFSYLFEIIPYTYKNYWKFGKTLQINYEPDEVCYHKMDMQINIKVNMIDK